MLLNTNIRGVTKDDSEKITEAMTKNDMENIFEDNIISINNEDDKFDNYNKVTIIPGIILVTLAFVKYFS